jgi:hypothetical protein
MSISNNILSDVIDIICIQIRIRQKYKLNMINIISMIFIYISIFIPTVRVCRMDGGATRRRSFGSVGWMVRGFEFERCITTHGHTDGTGV